MAAIKLGLDAEMHQTHRIPWGVDPGAHEPEQAAPQLVVGIQVTL